MQNRKHHIKASALGYAISFLLLVGLICSGVVFIASANKRIEINYDLEDHMLFNNYHSLTVGASFDHPGTKQIIHPSGDTTIVVVKNWGMLKSVVATTFHGNRQIVKTALTASQTDKVHPTLYYPDNKQKIKLCGKTRLEGTVYTSERGLERGNLAKKGYINDKLIYGELKKSDRYLPPLKPSIYKLDISPLFADIKRIESIHKDSTYSFLEKTSVYSQDGAIEINNQLKGNIIVRSLEKIFVSASAKLDNIILVAPVVNFEKGFRGTVQVYANKEIICEENVRLDYPSTLILNELAPDPTTQSIISIAEKSRVLGGILLISQKPNFRNPVRLEILGATVGGLVYNQGETEVQGSIIGSLYTNKIKLHAGGGIYGDHLLDAKLSQEKLPKDFLMPNWLKDEKSIKPAVLTCY